MTPMHSDDLTGWIQTGNWPQITAWLSARSANSYDAPAHLAQGLLCAYGPDHNRDLPRALSHVASACQLAPDNAHYLSTLSELQLQAEDPASALVSARLARQADRRYAMAAIALARAAFACGNRPAAYQNFCDAAQLLPAHSGPVRDQVETMIFRLHPRWFQPVIGKRVSLVPVTPAHYDFVFNCRQNAQFQQLYNIHQRQDAAAVSADIARAQHHPIDTGTVQWVVEHNGQPIGLSALADLNLETACTEYMLGFPQKQPSTFTVEAMLLALHFTFTVLELEITCGFTYLYNQAAHRSWVHLGFKQMPLPARFAATPRGEGAADNRYYEMTREAYFTNPTIARLSRRLLGQAPGSGNLRPPTALQTP